MSNAALVVDKAGLARKLAGRPKAFIFWELLQNALDESGVTAVRVTAVYEGAARRAVVTVEDDAPGGFSDLASVYTMFRDSKKGTDPTKRGRFELGEKLVIAASEMMTVTSTTGTVLIKGDKRTSSAHKRAAGTVVTAHFRMTRADFEEALSALDMFIVPPEIAVIVNGRRMGEREKLATFSATLQTVHADGEGVLRTTQRRADVDVYVPIDGEVPHIYEMGIPVVETGDKFHYNVNQRVPVNWERNSVPPSYLRTLRVLAVNELAEHLRKEDAASVWIDDAIQDERIAPEALRHVITERFGEKTVIFDPSDLEGTKLAVSQGYAVVHGGTLSGGAWSNVKKHGVLLPAGQVTPSPKVYSPDGTPENIIPREEWTDDMHRIANGSARLASEIGLGVVRVCVVREPHVRWCANFGREPGANYRLCLNDAHLSSMWELPVSSERWLELLIHEFAHGPGGSDHLSSEYHDALSSLGAKLTRLALASPTSFNY